MLELAGTKVLLLLLGGLMAMTPLSAVYMSQDIGFADGVEKEIKEYMDYYEIVIKEPCEGTLAIHFYIEKDLTKGGRWENITNDRIVVVREDGDILMWDEFEEFEIREHINYYYPLSNIDPNGLEKKELKFINEWREFKNSFGTWDGLENTLKRELNQKCIFGGN